MKNIKLEQNVNLHLVQTKKYKTITMFANFANEFTLEEKVMKTLLSYIMRDRCEKYPSKKDFGTILDLLYGANCRANTASIGNVFSFTYFGVVLNPLFTDKSLDDFIAIYKELLFFPLFSEENLKDAKNICKLIIERKRSDDGNWNIVIVGSGPTGVELAGAFAEMKKDILPRDYPHMNFDDLKILLEYKNPHKKPFYTVYSNSNDTEKNKYTRKKPKEFK